MPKKIKLSQSIDKGVKIPVKGSLPLLDMEIGDSIELPLDQRSKIATQAAHIKRRKGIVFTVRKVSDKTFRVWRTE